MNVFSALRAQVLVLLLLASVLQAAKLYGQITRKSALLEYLEFCDENPAVAVDPVRLDRAARECKAHTIIISKCSRAGAPRRRRPGRHYCSISAPAA